MGIAKRFVTIAAAIALLPALAVAEVPDREGWMHDSEALPDAVQPKAISARSVASRGTVTSGVTLYGGFDTATNGTIFILVRGNSLGALGVTQNYLDLPTVRLYDSAGRELISSSGSCSEGPVTDYYRNTRGQPAHPRDACVFNQNAGAGVVTFTVTPSANSSRAGEVLFEVTLGP